MARWNRKPPAGTQIDWSHPLSQKLVTAWTFAEGSGVPADLVRRRSATVVGAPTWRGGRSGSAIQFDPSNAYNSVTPTTTESTIAALVCCTSPTASAWQSVCARGTVTGSQLFIGVSSTNFWVVSGATAASDSISSVSADNNWHTLVGVSGSGIIRLYLDGYEITSKSVTVTVSNSTLSIARNGHNSADYWRGLIECVYSWDRALTGDEVKAWHADPYGMLMPPVPRRSWFLPTSPPPPASSGNLLLLGVG